jgi:integrase
MSNPTDLADHLNTSPGDALDRWISANGFDAQARAAAVASLLTTGPPAGRAVPWEKFEPELMAQYHPSLRSKATKRYMEHAVRVLRNDMCVSYVHDLDIRLITRLVATRDPKLSPNSVRSLLRAVQSVCSAAVNLGYLPISPFKMRPIRTWVRASKPKGVRHFSKDEMRAIFELMARDVVEKRGWAQYRARRDQALFTLIAYSGLRLSEALWAHVVDLDLDGGIIMVVSRPDHKLKTAGSEKPVTLANPNVCIPLLRDWASHRLDAPPLFDRPRSAFLFPNVRTMTPWINGGPGTTPLARLQAVARRCGIERANFQMVRRTVATTLEALTSPGGVQRILRHSNVGVTQAYYMQADIAQMKKSMEGFQY